MKSKTFSGRSLRSSLKGSTWILVLLLLGSMVAFPVAELMLIGNQTDEIHRMTFAMICSYLIVPGFLVTMLAAVVNALNEFWYLFSRDKIDFYHSLPVTRSRFFWEKAIRGLLLYLVPYVIMELITMAIAVSKGHGSHLITAAGKMFLEHLLMYLLLYFGAVLALAIAGNILAGILSLCCVYLYGPVLGILLWVLEMMYFRTNMGLKEGMAEKISVFLSPVSISVALRTYSGQKNFWIIIVGGILLLIVLAVCAYLAYTKRPAEKTGKSFVYGFLEPILLFMVVIPAALAIGTMFALIGPEENRTGWWIFGLVLGTVVFYGILQVIFAMDFRKMAAHKLQLLLLGICVAVSAWILHTDAIGYDTRIPTMAKTEGISLNLEWIGTESVNEPQMEVSSGSYKLDRLFYFMGGNYGRWTDAGMSDKIYEVLKEIASYQNSKECSGTEIGVQFKKKSGFDITRQYIVTAEQLGRLLEACYEQGTLKDNKYDILEKYRQKVSFITVDPLNELDDQYSVTLEKSDSQKLLDLLKQDIAEASPQELVGIPCGQMELYATSYADMDEHIAPESYAEVGRYIFPTFKRTLVFLKEKGYAFVMEKENLKQYDYSVTYNAEEMDVTDPEQKEELAQSLIRELECPAWLETEAGVSVKVALNSTESAGESLNGIEFAVLKAKEPEFIKKIVETGEEDAGAGTRSEVKKFIQKGKVQVNGVPAKKSEIKVSEEDEVVLDGNRISQAPEFVYYLLHKPAGYVSATEDKRDKTVMELVASDRKGLFPVGRLDKDTEGLLLITDDGALAHELLSPKKHVDKTYYAVTDGCMTKEDVQRFADGLEIGEKNPTMPAKLEILSTRKVEETELEQYPSGWSSEIQLTIKEGKFHQVKRMTEAVGKKVVYLKRISMGVLTLPDDLKKGECRQLTAEEEKRLKESVVTK